MGAKNDLSTRELLIQSGLEELRQYGVDGFSTRRVAKACGLSCAAPYKHFKDTREFIREIFGHVERQFLCMQQQVLEKYAKESVRRQLVEIALAYIQFLTEHPTFRRVVMMLEHDGNEDYRCLCGRMSMATTGLVAKYCEQVQMPPETRVRKTFLVRSLIYSAAMFFCSGELEYNADNMAMVEGLLDREFDLA